jgi:hypothetical protein
MNCVAFCMVVSWSPTATPARPQVSPPPHFDLPTGGTAATRSQYPPATLDRDQILNELLPFLRQLVVYSRGRFGAGKYEVGNQDHSCLQCVEAVEHILHGHAELTVENPDLVNSRHNPFPYRDWASAQERGPRRASVLEIPM